VGWAVTARRIVNTKDKGVPLLVPQPVGVVALLQDPRRCRYDRGTMATVRTVLLLVVLPLAPLGAPQATEGKPSLWAVYYSWYETATGPHGRWSQWMDDKKSAGKPLPKSKAQPLIGYYDSDDPVIVRWHIRLAKAADIDAFLVSWWGGANLSGAAFEKVVLPVAAEEGFKVAMCSELAQFHQDVKVLTR
jgi:hypothetical protein